MFKTNKWMFMLLISSIIINVLCLIISCLFYFKIFGPNANFPVKEWFFEQVKVNMGSRPINTLSLSSNTECLYPNFNIFSFGHPKGDAVNRYCLCKDDGDFSEFDLGNSNENSSSETFTCNNLILYQ